MKSSIVLFTILAAYFGLLAVVYTLWNIAFHGNVEWVGSVTILLSGGLSGFIAFYLWLTMRKQGGVLTEDLLEADIDDGDPEVGEFSPWSWWPILLALGASLFMLGLAIGGYNFWFTFITFPIIPVSIVGWVYEYYRGHFAR